MFLLKDQQSCKQYLHCSQEMEKTTKDWLMTKEHQERQLILKVLSYRTGIQFLFIRAEEF